MRNIKFSKKCIWYFGIEMDQLIHDRRLNIVLFNKKKKRNENQPSNWFWFPSGSLNENKRKQITRQLHWAWQRTEKTTEHEVDGETNYGWCSYSGLLMLKKGTGWVENRSTNRDYPDYNIDKIGKNTQKTPRDDLISHRLHRNTTSYRLSERIKKVR